VRLWCQISELVSEIGERYEIGSPITARRLTGGYAMTSSGPTPTARPRCTSKHPPVDADSLNWEHRLLAHAIFCKPDLAKGR
jgi:hypothetical protein